MGIVLTVIIVATIIFMIGFHYGSKDGAKKESAAFQLIQHCNKINKEFENEKKQFKDIRDMFDIEKKTFNDDLQKFNDQKLQFNKIRTLKINQFPLLGSILADIDYKSDMLLVNQLRFKKHPALTAAETVKSVNQKNHVLNTQLKSLEYKVKYYESLFPTLSDLDDELTLTDTPVVYNVAYSNLHNDAAGYWLSTEEYQLLSPSQKYQRALDRYFHRQKSNIEIGTDYERYIGYCYEQKGFAVIYQGILAGKSDLGRDLICKKNGQTHIVQCKCWSSKKLIREKHINQLFGTTVEYYLSKNPESTLTDFSIAIAEKKIIPSFVTSTNYSDEALSFAKSLGIQCFKEVKLDIYPMIKCNINKATGDHIYHLPFDQQYNTVKLDSPGEFIALSIADAEAAGFRRAMHWSGR